MDNIDFEKLATKDDLKKELNELDEKLSTSFKSEINRLEDKIFNLDEKVNTLDEKVNTLDEKVNTLDEKVDALDAKFDKKIDALDEKLDGRFDEVINHIDGALKVFKDTKEETAAHTVSYREHAEILDNHEKRIKVLEVRPAGA